MAMFGIAILVNRQSDPPQDQEHDQDLGNIKGNHKSLLMKY